WNGGKIKPFMTPLHNPLFLLDNVILQHTPNTTPKNKQNTPKYTTHALYDKIRDHFQKAADLGFGAGYAKLEFHTNDGWVFSKTMLRPYIISKKVVKMEDKSKLRHYSS
ncbi:hypothetical protein, partial [Helicobacter heilmannii]